MGACLVADADLATNGPATNGPATKEIDAVAACGLLAASRTVPFAVVSNGSFAFANPAFKSLFRADARIIGRPLTQLIAAHSQAALGTALSAPAETAATFRGRANRFDGTSFEAEFLLARETLDGAPVICLFGEDISWRHVSEKHLNELAYTDMLTGLPNRALLLDRLRDAIIDARDGNAGMAVFMADLDGLKSVNDTYGHQAGDVVLQVTGQRFLACIRDRDTLARLGGDEFCVVLPRVRDAATAGVIADRLVDAARQPIVIDGAAVSVGVSVGIALFPDHGATADELIAAADSALYAAKRGGRNRFAMACAPHARPVIALPLIAWSAAYDLGITSMDRQHRQLAQHLNDLAAALRRSDEPGRIADLLAATLGCARHHFECEDRLMAEHRVADAAAHQAMHAQLLDDLQSFSAGYDTRSLSLTMRFFQEWLLRHIDSADRPLAAALKANGVH
jgi:diguanylate cyclase (GGDEF)-like protein/hemerythrin-like metal-binding protein